MDIKNIFGKVQELRNFRADVDDDDDILDSAVSNDDYEDSGSSNKFSGGFFDSRSIYFGSFSDFTVYRGNVLWNCGIPD